MKLNEKFYLRNDVVKIAKELIGKRLCTLFDGGITSGIICETEAYAGATDRASHAWNGRFTERTKVMYAEGGTAYVYLCYGIHHLFNVVTNKVGIPHAVLVRGVIPDAGEDIMLQRLGKAKLPKILSGPGVVSKALGIHTGYSGLSLHDNEIWIEDGIKIKQAEIKITPRIGIDYAGEDALLPYRFRWM